MLRVGGFVILPTYFNKHRMSHSGRLVADELLLALCERLAARLNRALGDSDPEALHEVVELVLIRVPVARVAKGKKDNQDMTYI